jgi:hypothetical protein
MTNQELLNTYSDQIQSIITHAKSIDFDIENGNIMDLMKSWLDMGRKMMININDNKSEVLILMKNLVNK